MTGEAPTKQPEEMYCSNCGTPVKRDDQFCPECGTATGSAPGATPSTGAVASRLDRVELRREGLFFHAYPMWVMVLLSILTLGIYTLFWLNHWHGVMPKRRHDDPSTAKAIGFLFIPLYNLYWIFESLLRLCTRLDEELAAAGLPDRVPKELVRWFCILYLVPYINLLTNPILGAIATGRMQSLVNRLADFDVTELGQQQGTR